MQAKIKLLSLAHQKDGRSR
ncbi:hypothetical protein pdam_00015935 [Pocillopora damicornis]|uniref:Uncharacterized protein n=1 Tax=Pocillopora damicornis TaxID=46731 RepID=A0A3M6UWD3_POCDA|nr:hypothetical protein pdam_00015935 [Pocillopora damicornis]